MKIFNRRKYIQTIAFVALVLVFVSVGAQMAFAVTTPPTPTVPAPSGTPQPSTGTKTGILSGLFGIGDVTASVIGFIVQVIGSIIGYVGGVFFALGGYLVTVALKMNMDVLNSPIVATGWGIVINFTNLGFVFAIIIISFATIFRVQSYAMQQTLKKLIIAALLVNFSLVIAGAFISISDIFSNFFMDRIGGSSTPGAWGEAFGGMFQAQRLLQVQQTSAAAQSGFLTVAGGFSASLLGNISQVLFVALFTILAAITIFAVAIMLIIRYVYLGILLILSPIVWLLWIFPSTSGHWKKWWDKFLTWTFFAPIVLFFLSLSIYSVMYYQSEVDKFQDPVFDTSLAGSIGFGIARIGEMAVVIGLVMGGLMAAQSMGIAFSGIAMGWAKGSSKAFGSWAGRKGIRLGTLPMRSEWGRKKIEQMQKTGTAGGFGGFIARNTLGRLGNKIGAIGINQGEGLASRAEGRQKGLSDKQLAMQVSTMTADEKVAALTRLTKSKNLDMVPNLAKYVGDSKMKNIFASYGKGKEYGDMEKTAGFNTAMLTGRDKDGKEVSIEKATDDFAKSYSIKDYDKLQGTILSKYDASASMGLSEEQHAKIKDLRTQSIFDNHPGAISKVRSSLKGDNVKEFQNKLDEYVDNFEQATFPEEYRGDKKPLKLKIAWIEEQFRKATTDEEKTKWKFYSNHVRGLYNSRKNFGGSLFGGGGGGGQEKQETT